VTTIIVRVSLAHTQRSMLGALLFRIETKIQKYKYYKYYVYNARQKCLTAAVFVGVVVTIQNAVTALARWNALSIVAPKIFSSTIYSEQHCSLATSRAVLNTLGPAGLTGPPLETPKAITGSGECRKVLLPSRSGGMGSVVSSHRGVRGRTPAENGFGTFSA